MKWVLLLVTPFTVLKAQPGPSPRPEFRIDAVAARASSIQVGIGVQSVAGIYVRWGATVTAGIADAPVGSRTVWRAEAVTRFLLDPFREHAQGLYGLAGVGLMDIGPGGTDPRALAGVGVEWGQHGRTLTSTEVALGGGVRVSVVFRRARPSRR